MNNLEGANGSNKRDFLLRIEEGDVEMRGGKPVCTLENALRLIAEFHRIFPDKYRMEIMGHEFVKRDDEKEIFDHAYDVVRQAVFSANGLSPDTISHTIEPDEFKYAIIELIFGIKSNRPQVQVYFAHSRAKVSVDELIDSVDDEKDPYGKLYLRTAIEDVRIDIGELMKRMVHFVDAEVLFARPSVLAEKVQQSADFRAVVDNLRGRIGLPAVGPSFKIVRF